MHNKKSLFVTFTFCVIVMLFILTGCTGNDDPGGNKNPSMVVNIYPKQSERIEKNHFYARWTLCSSPVGRQITYRINFSKTIDELDNEDFFETRDNYFLMPHLSEGVWYWQVTVIDETRNRTTSPIWNFTVNSDALPQPVDTDDLQPDPTLYVSKQTVDSFTLDWPEYQNTQHPERDVTYTIYLYEQDQNNLQNSFKQRFFEKQNYWQPRINPARIGHTTSTTHRFTNLGTDTSYDWIILGSNSASQTSLIGGTQIKMGNTPPNNVILLSPLNGGDYLSEEASFLWTQSVDPDDDEVSYYLFLDTIKTSYNLVTPIEGLKGTQYIPDNLPSGRTWYWFVMTKDEHGAATRTDTQMFRTLNPVIGIPENPVPADTAVNISPITPPLLQWAQNHTAQQITYTVYMGTRQTAMFPIASGITQKEYQLTELLQGDTLYYWQIKSEDAQSGQTSLSALWSFTTAGIDAPLQEAAQTNVEGTQIELRYDRAMSDPSGQHSHYTVKKTTQNAESRTLQVVPGNKIEIKPGTTNTYLLTLEERLTSADILSVDYSPGSISAVDGGILTAFTGFPISNMMLLAAEQPTPADGSLNVDALNPPLLQWEHNNKGQQITYTVYLGTSQSTMLPVVSGITQKAWQITEPLYGNSIYYWQIEARESSSGQTILSDVWSFKTAIIIAPVQQNALTNTTGNQIELIYSKAMSDPSGQHSHYTVKKTTQDSEPRTVQVVTNNKIEFKPGMTNTYLLTLAEALSTSDVVTVDYSPGSISAADGGILAAFSNFPVDNQVVGNAPVVTNAQILQNGQAVAVTFNKPMTPLTANEIQQFGLFINGFINDIESAVMSLDGQTITFNMRQIVGKHNKVHLSYIKGTVTSADKGPLESFLNLAVDTSALTTIWVIPDVDWHYSGIQSAIDAAAVVDGDIITVAPGHYRENVKFKKKKITLKSIYEEDPNAVNNTIIDGQNNDLAAVTMGTEWAPFPVEERTTHIPTIEGFTIKNGSYDPNRPFPLYYPGGVNIFEVAEVKNNIIKQNGSESTGFEGSGINIYSVDAIIHNNIIEENYNTDAGAGIYIFTAFSTITHPQIYENIIRNNKADFAAGIFIEPSTLPLNANGTSWKVFNSPSAEVTFVENIAAASVNSYSNNIVNTPTNGQGADIFWDVSISTTLGTLTAVPATKTEEATVTVDINYLIGTEYHNGSLWFTLERVNARGFDITDDASLIIGNNSTPLSAYDHTATQATITGIDLISGTVTLRLEPQETPSGTTAVSARDVSYPFKVRGDADGPDAAWTQHSTVSINFVSVE